MSASFVNLHLKRRDIPLAASSGRPASVLAARWKNNKDSLVGFAHGNINLAQLYTAIGSPAGGKRQEPDYTDWLDVDPEPEPDEPLEPVSKVPVVNQLQRRTAFVAPTQLRLSENFTIC